MTTTPLSARRVFRRCAVALLPSLSALSGSAGAQGRAWTMHPVASVGVTTSPSGQLPGALGGAAAEFILRDGTDRYRAGIRIEALAVALRASPPNYALLLAGVTQSATRGRAELYGLSGVGAYRLGDQETDLGIHAGVGVRSRAVRRQPRFELRSHTPGRRWSATLGLLF